MKWNKKIALSNKLLKLFVYVYKLDIQLVKRQITKYKYIKETEEFDYDSPYLKTVYEVYLDHELVGKKTSRLDDVIQILISIKENVEAVRGGE